MDIRFLISNLGIESYNMYVGLTSWKTELSGGHHGLFPFSMPKEFIKKIKSFKKFENVKEELINQIRSNLNKKRLEKDLDKLEKAWKQNKKDILIIFKKIFRVEPKNVKCYLIFCCNWGSYNPKNSEIYVNYKMPLLYTFAHELFHLFFYKNIKINKGNEKEIWKLDEVLVNFVLLRTELKNLWPDVDEHYYCDENEINKLWDIWQKENSLNNFVKKALNN